MIEFDETESNPPIPFDYPKQVRIADKGRYADQIELWHDIIHDFGPCAKLYRRDWLMNEKIHFPERGNFEDNEFVIDVYLRASRIAVLSKPTYFYRKYNSRTGLTQSTSVSIASLQDQIGALTKINEKYRLSAGGSLERALYKSLVSKLRRELQRFGFENGPGTDDGASRFAAWLRTQNLEMEANELLLDLY